MQSNIKFTNDIFYFYFWFVSSQPSGYFTFTARPNLEYPYFKCSVATCC